MRATPTQANLKQSVDRLTGPELLALMNFT
jgi:hypothetical protein